VAYNKEFRSPHLESCNNSENRKFDAAHIFNWNREENIKISCAESHVFHSDTKRNYAAT
jgi:hypothetical protein